ncbi:MAG: hydrogenase maturation nickel metallochaperone HypA [Propionibacteriaceae bacterium]|nr:hydrogenase maturation nickel metallochaperone HypA [Propionibacteriaceae bacterium]
MHELALSRSIKNIVTKAAGGRKVVEIWLDVGSLRQVIPQTLTHCWAIVAQPTELAGSQLRINEIPAAVHCYVCGQDAQVDVFSLYRCPNCDSDRVAVIAGEEFAITHIEVEA